MNMLLQYEILCRKEKQVAQLQGLNSKLICHLSFAEPSVSENKTILEIIIFVARRNFVISEKDFSWTPGTKMA